MKPGDLVRYPEGGFYPPDGIGVVLGVDEIERIPGVQFSSSHRIKVLWETGEVRYTFSNSLVVIHGEG